MVLVISFNSKFGTIGSGDGEFSQAGGIFVDSSGDIFVVDTSNHRVQKFDSSFNFLGKFGTNGSGDGQFNFPLDILVDLFGNIFVADTNGNRVQKFDSNFAFIGKFGQFGTGDGDFKTVNGIFVDTSGNIFVTDGVNHRVQKFDSNFNFLGKFGTLGSGDGEFNNPHKIFVDTSGNIFVTDRDNNRVQKFDSSFNFLDKFGTFGTGDNNFNSPRGIKLDSSGNIYVMDTFNNKIKIFNSSFVFEAKFGSGGTGDGEFNTADGIALDSSKNIYIADRLNNRIQKLNQADVLPIAPPVNITTVPSNSTVIVSWDAQITVPPITNYIVEFSENQIDWIKFDAPISTDTNRTINPLTNNQVFFFRVSAVNSVETTSPSTPVTDTPQNFSVVEYCTVNDVMRRLRMAINSNTLPDDITIETYILQAQDYIDRTTGHSWRKDRQMRNELFDTVRLYDWGHGMPLPMKHRMAKIPLDASKGDKVEFWNGQEYELFDLPDTLDGNFNIIPELAELYIKGWFLTFFRKHRFRMTYRYGSDQEGELIPHDIRKACILLVCIDILDTDFKMSLIPYSEEGKIQKEALVRMWTKQAEKIIKLHKEILTVW